MSANLFADGSDEICYGLSRDAPSVSEAAERPRPVERERGASGTDPEDLTPLSKQQSDLGSLFSIDDFNPFSINSDHFDEQNNADRTITDERPPALAAGLETSSNDSERLLPLNHSESRLRRFWHRISASGASFVHVKNEPRSTSVTFQQAVVLLEDAAFYRSINHSLKENVLEMYRFYHSRIVAFLRYVFIFLIHILAFFESPSSLSISSDLDPRRKIEVYQVPRNILIGIEIFLLFCFFVDVVTKGYLAGSRQFFRSKWLIAYLLVVIASFIELAVHMSLPYDPIRIRRIFRPFFLLQNSSLLKKTVHCLKKSLPEVLAILFLLLLHIYIFSLVFLLIFPYHASAAPTIVPSNSTVPSNSSIIGSPPDLEEAFISLFVLLTTANNPDVTMPLYTYARLYALFFILFLLIGLYCFMNMLTAVIYNQFRGYFLTSMQSSHIRRVVALRASFEVLRHLAPTDDDESGDSSLSTTGEEEVLRRRPPSNFVPATMLKELVTKADLRHRNKPMLLDRIQRLPIQPGYSCSQFMKLFDLMDFHPLARKPTLVPQARPVARVLQFIFQHHWFTLFGNLVTFVNVVCITYELFKDKSGALAVTSPLYVWNMIFIVYYIADLVCKIWSQGWELYLWSIANVYEGFVTILIIIAEAFHIMEFGFPHERGGDDVTPIWNIGISFQVIVRIVNILIILRLLRILADVKAMNLVASTIYDIFLNLTPFAGILVVMYYTFAIIGMELFKDTIKFSSFGPAADFANVTPEAVTCGSYQQLGYWPNNFNDFASTIVVLWDLMVVNNWHVFLKAYKEVTGGWSQLFFILWFIVSVVIGLNLFTALILENFIMRWDKAQKDAIMRERLLDCAQNAGVQYSVNHPHLTVSELDESVNHTVHNLFRSNFRVPEETEIMTAVHSHQDLQSLMPRPTRVSPVPDSIAGAGSLAPSSGRPSSTPNTSGDA